MGLQLLIFVALIAFAIKSNAQATNQFTQYDCDGNYHDLYQEVDSGHVVIIEFIMNCGLCIDATVAIESMLNQFDQQYPGVIRLYQFAYSPLLDCSSMALFKDTNYFNSTTFEENSHLMSYYGGFGMPTIGVVAGPTHQDIFSQVGFIAADTAQLGNSIRNYFATIPVIEVEARNSLVNLFPNPATDIVNVKYETVDAFHYNIVDVMGKIVMSSNSSELKNGINISGLPNGIYSLNLIFTNSSVSNKLIVSH